MNNKPKAIVFGAGNVYLYEKNFIDTYFDVIAIVDNSTKKQGTLLCGMEIQSPEK